ncbi:MAG: HAD hydrolase-like protein [bacterium]|nr:HAD hydrolase-like protein [bacterium]
MRPEAVLFDFDGTLADSEGIHALIRQVVCKAMGLDPQKFHTGGKALDEYFATIGLGRDEVALYRKLWQLRETDYVLRAFPDANIVLEMLAWRGVRLGIVTNREATPYLVNAVVASGLNCDRILFLVAHHKNPFWARTRIFFAKGIMLPCPVIPSPHPKPDPRFIDPVRHKLIGLPGYPRSVLVVGDTLVDLEFAKKNGFTFAATLQGALKDRAIWEAHEADIILPRLCDLLKYIDQPRRL